MPHDTPFLSLLQEHLQLRARLRKQRLDLLALLLEALIALSTVNLAKLALHLPAKPESNYRRIQRFFAEQKLPQQATADFAMHLLPEMDRLVISIDRTTWHFGKTPINVFMASIVHDGTAFPLVWIMLSKAGCSNGAEQRALLRKLFCVVPPERVAVVLADREFIGKAFMEYLTGRGVGYGVRIRKNARVGLGGAGGKAKTQSAEDLFSDLEVGQARRLRTRRTQAICYRLLRAARAALRPAPARRPKGRAPLADRGGHRAPLAERLPPALGHRSALPMRDRHRRIEVAGV